MEGGLRMDIKIARIIKLLKFVKTIEDKEIVNSTIDSIIDMLEE